MSPGPRIPIIVITIGIGWLLTTLDIVPGVNWVWTLSLAGLGLATLANFGFDKVSIVIGPFFLITSILSVLRQTGRLHIDIEMPILVITLGLLMLIARLQIVPAPRWLDADTKHEAAKSP